MPTAKTPTSRSKTTASKSGASRSATGSGKGAATKAAPSTARSTAPNTAAKSAPKTPSKPNPAVPSPVAPGTAMGGSPAAEASPATRGPADFKRKDLLDAVAKRVDLKKRDIRPVLEATLAVLGETIGSGRTVNLEPMGKLMTTRQTENAQANITFVKLRRKKDTPSA